MTTISIIALNDGQHAGDDNNALGIQRALQSRLISEGIDVIVSTSPITPESIIHLKTTFEQEADTQFIVVGAGVQCLEPLYQLKQANPNILTSWSGYQYFAELDEPKYQEKIDYIALPAHILTDEVKAKLSHNQEKVISTVGVPHNTRSETILAEYQKKKGSILEKDDIPEKDKYLFVILAGDASDSTGKMNYFTEAEAFKLGQFSAQKAIREDRYILATNDPRTGKIELAHRVVHTKTKMPLDYQIDWVSQEFNMGVKSITSDNIHTFYDFKFLAVDGESAYKSILGALNSDSSKHAVLVPGESTLMISEVCDLLPNSETFVYLNGAMNAEHRAFVDSVCAAGKALALSLLPEVGFVVPSEEAEENAAGSAADKIARVIQDALVLKLLQSNPILLFHLEPLALSPISAPEVGYVEQDKKVGHRPS